MCTCALGYIARCRSRASGLLQNSSHGVHGRAVLIHRFSEMNTLSTLLPRWTLPQWLGNAAAQTAAPGRQIEDFRSGYPRYSALIAAHKPWFIFRTFDRLRARLLLQKQDRLAVLEQDLEKADNDEACPLFLGKCRIDSNEGRAELLAEIDSCLKDYDSLLERTHRYLSFSPPQQQDVESLRNWVDGTGSIARDEAAYLLESQDLSQLTADGDVATTQLESWAEDKMIQFIQGFRKLQGYNISTDQHVYIYRGCMLRRITQLLLLILVAVLLLLPIIICNLVNGSAARMVIIATFTFAYLIIILYLTKLKTIELVMAGATYATIMTVFVSSTAGN